MRETGQRGTQTLTQRYGGVLIPVLTQQVSNTIWILMYDVCVSLLSLANPPSSRKRLKLGGDPVSCLDYEYILWQYTGVSKSFQIRRLEREQQMVQLSHTRCSCITIVSQSVSFAAITLCVTSQWVFIVVVAVYFVMIQSGNFWIHPRIWAISIICCILCWET